MENIASEKEAFQDEMAGIEAGIDSIHSKIKQLDAKILIRSKELGFEKIISKDDIERQKQELVGNQTKLENYRASLEEKWELQKNIQSEIGEKKLQVELSIKEVETFKNELEKILAEIEINHKKETGLKQENILNNEEIKKLQLKLKSMDKIIMDSLEKQSGLLKEFKDKKPLLESKIMVTLSSLTDCLQNERSVKETREMVSQIISQLKDNFDAYKKYYENILDILYSDDGTYTQKENTQKNIENLTDSIYQNEQELDKVRIKIRELQAVRESIQNNYNKNDFELNSLKNEIKKMSGQLLEVQESMKILENRINSTSDSINKKQSLIEGMSIAVDEYDEEIRKLKAERNRVFDDLNKKKIDYARIEEKYNSLTNEINRIKNQISDIERMSASYETDKTNSLAILSELSNRIEADTLSLENYTRKIEKFRNEIETFKSDIESIQKSKKVLEIQRKDISDNIQKIEKTVMSLENAISERKGFLDSIVENARNNYGLDIRGIKIQSGDNFEGISSQINIIRSELLTLGDVNLLAIEQYQNAKERLEFLNVQKQDSEKAMADIIQLIEETNARCIDQFSTAFEDIRKAFKKIFARLFDGGRADLVLENDKDMLNSGINIFAEPPGKKFQSISLLSGGERALVAIAVIFSILYLKPTPFVVLDEMDAPLDDDNIERFKAIVKDFKQSSQFIIVSHSKSTLEICDALYGVTMEEQGVSKVVSVAFDEADLLFKTDGQS